MHKRNCNCSHVLSSGAQGQGTPFQCVHGVSTMSWRSQAQLVSECHQPDSADEQAMPRKGAGATVFLHEPSVPCIDRLVWLSNVMLTPAVQSTCLAIPLVADTHAMMVSFPVHCTPVAPVSAEELRTPYLGLLLHSLCCSGRYCLLLASKRMHRRGVCLIGQDEDGLQPWGCVAL